MAAGAVKIGGVNVLLLKAWLGDNAAGLIGARLRDVRQVDAKSFAVQFAGPTQAWLLVSILEGYPTLAMLTDDDPLISQDFKESGFVKALRFHLAGATLNSITQQGFDRSVVFDFTRTDIYGRETQRTLRVELVGRASNAYLLSEKSMVISMFKPVPAGRNSVRRVVTGKLLPPPPPLGKFVAEEGSVESFEATLRVAEEADHDHPVRELLTRHVAGPDVNLWSRLEPLLPVDHSEACLLEFVTALQAGVFTSQLFELEGSSPNEATLQAWRSQRSGQAQTTAKSERPVDQRVLQIQSQLELAKRAEELEAASAEMLRRAGSFASRELESAFLKGWQLSNPDWVDKIDLAKSTEDNAGTLIEYAQRLKRARPKLEEMVASTSKSRETNVDLSGDLAVAPATQHQDPLTRDIAKLERNGVKYLRFTTSDGIAILVGQTDRSNDELVRHYGSSRHLWLHVRDYPGSHVLLLTNGRDVPQRSLEEAAVVAGYYSQGRGEIDLDVSYTPVKQLRRPKGGKPGQVLKLSEKVVRVNPMRFEAIRDSLRIQT